MNRKICVAFVLAMAMVLSGCRSSSGDNGSENTETVGLNQTTVSPDGIETEDDVTDISAETVSSEMFSDRDFEVGYDENESAKILLNGDTASCDSNAVTISGSTVTIMDEGTYILSGTLDDGMIIINAEKADKIQLVLDGVNIHSETSSPIYVLQADKVFVTMAAESENTLSNGGTFTAIDDNNIDAVIFSKEDLTLNGQGTMIISSPAGHGIVSKDELTLTSGTYDINSASHGLTGKDGICIANVAFTIVSGKDGIQAENEDDATLGYVYIQSGTFDISSEGDGISAGAYAQIEDGSFNITSGGGSVNAATQTSESWGNYMGGGSRQMGGGMGGPMDSHMGGNIDGSSTDATATETTDDSTSIKGIKATGNVIINGGVFYMDSADDSVHSNASVTVNGGEFEIASGDDAFHADETLTINAGTIHVTTSYEGLEGLNVVVNGGDIQLVSTDDGLNAAGGTDASGMGGMRGTDQFGGGMMNGGASDGSITISGGNLYVNASGDGIDANGSVLISGGYTVVTGPTQGDTATLDYDTSAEITGGTFIGTGASMMAQTFSGSGQGVISVSVGDQAAGTAIRLTDVNGNEIINYAPELSFGVVILSSPDMVSGDTYTITVGSASGAFEAN